MYAKNHHYFNALLRHHLEVLEKYGDIKDLYDFFITRNVILDWTNVHTFTIDNSTAFKAVVVAINSFKKMEEVLQVQLDTPPELQSEVLLFMQSKLQLKQPLFVRELLIILWRTVKWISTMIVKMLGRSVSIDKSVKDQGAPVTRSTTGIDHDLNDKTGKTVDPLAAHDRTVRAHDTIDPDDRTGKTLDTVTKKDRTEKTLEIVTTNDGAGETRDTLTTNGRIGETCDNVPAHDRTEEIQDKITLNDPTRKTVTFSNPDTLSDIEKDISQGVLTESDKSNQHDIVDILIKELWIQIPLCYDLQHPMPSYSAILNTMMSNWQRYRFLKNFFEVGCNMFESDVNGNNLLQVMIAIISVQSLVELGSAEQLLILILKNGGACFLHETSKNEKTSLNFLKESQFVQHMPEVQKMLERYPDNCYFISLQCLCAIEIKRSLVKCHNLPKSLVQFINNHSHLVK